MPDAGGPAPDSKYWSERTTQREEQLCPEPRMPVQWVGMAPPPAQMGSGSWVSCGRKSQVTAGKKGQWGHSVVGNPVIDGARAPIAWNA